MSKTKKTTQAVTVTIKATRYDLVVNASKPGMPPADGNLAGKDLARLTIVGKVAENNGGRGVCYITFFPNKSNLQSPVHQVINGATVVSLEMNISQLWGACGVLQNIPNCATIYTTISGKPQAELTTTNGARVKIKT